MRPLSLRGDLVEMAEAKRRGMTLETWMEDAVMVALEPRRIEFPIVFTSKSPGTLKITNEDIRRMEEEDDLRMLGMLD